MIEVAIIIFYQPAMQRTSEMLKSKMYELGSLVEKHTR